MKKNIIIVIICALIVVGAISKHAQADAKHITTDQGLECVVLENFGFDEDENHNCIDCDWGSFKKIKNAPSIDERKAKIAKNLENFHARETQKTKDEQANKQQKQKENAECFINSIVY